MVEPAQPKTESATQSSSTQSSAAAPVIEMRDVTKVYHMGTNEFQALRGVSFNIYPGEYVAVIGASGSGKSTLMNLIGLLDRPTAGSYRIRGTNVSQLSKNRMAEMRNREIGFVFQRFNLLARTQARRQVELPLFYAGITGGKAGEMAMAALAKVGLAEWSHHKPDELSGGQQQRVALARALVFEPRVLLLDEPLSNLDARLRGEMRDEIKAVTDRLGMTTLFVTHDQSEALAMSDRVAVMREGRILEAAAPEELTERPRTAFTAQFLGGRTVLPGRVEVSGTGPMFRLEGGAGLPLAPGIADTRPTHAVLRATRLGLADAADGATSLAVEVERAIFLGDARQVDVRAGSARIRVYLPGERPAPTVGARLHLAIPETAIRFIHDAQAS